MFKNIYLFLCLVITMDSGISKQITYIKNITAIFPLDICNVTCGGRPHTLCRKNITEAEMYISKAQRAEMKSMLILGHNGLRNRLAERMNVGNMVEMVWHHKLALMADTYIQKHNPFLPDPCTMFQKQKAKYKYSYVVQNRYFEKKAHYPNILIENAFRSWYMERDNMSWPEKRFESELNHIILKSENNFTHLASPLTHNFGCGVDRYGLGYILICYYHPYIRNPNKETSFIYGMPGSLCPLTHPLRNSRESFANLCIGAERNGASCGSIHLFVVVIFCTSFIYS